MTMSVSNVLCKIISNQGVKGLSTLGQKPDKKGDLFDKKFPAFLQILVPWGYQIFEWKRPLKKRSQKIIQEFLVDEICSTFVLALLFLNFLDLGHLCPWNLVDSDAISMHFLDQPTSSIPDQIFQPKIVAKNSAIKRREPSPLRKIKSRLKSRKSSQDSRRKAQFV